MTAREADGDGLLHRAAGTGHADVFDAVLRALGSRLSLEEVSGDVSHFKDAQLQSTTPRFEDGMFLGLGHPRGYP